jgi:hypothetical protein
MRRAISDPTAGEKAREIAGAGGEGVRPMDPTESRFAVHGGAQLESDPTEPQPVGHVFGHRRNEPLPTPDPASPVLRLRGVRRVWRDRRARGV